MPRTQETKLRSYSSDQAVAIQCVSEVIYWISKMSSSISSCFMDNLNGKLTRAVLRSVLFRNKMNKGFIYGRESESPRESLAEEEGEEEIPEDTLMR